ncbi:MAG TPA: hypothetical protein VEK12_08210 [Alphaproteobacteria bacterium]|nr:hypothetical protein [Alphaproteobacteria bacterium]
MRRIALPSVIALALGTWAGVAPADAQTPPQPVCPAGYYLASDGMCYPGSPPVYYPPDYDVAPPIYQPPVIFDGFIPGIGYGHRGWGGHGHAGHGGAGRGGGHGRR